jgi:hypothetical protein
LPRAIVGGAIDAGAEKRRSDASRSKAARVILFLSLGVSRCAVAFMTIEVFQRLAAPRLVDLTGSLGCLSLVFFVGHSRT